MGAARPIVIIGAGGSGREVLDIVEAVNVLERRWEFLGFVDDGEVDPALLARRGARVVGPTSALADLAVEYVIGIGSPTARREVHQLCLGFGLQAATVIHPTATIGADVQHAEGLVAASHVSITTNVVIGRHVHLNLNSTIAHDCRLRDYVTVNPGANISGNVELEEGVTIGTGAAVIQGLRVGARSTVGAGAVVTRDVPSDSIAVGVPARWD